MIKKKNFLLILLFALISSLSATFIYIFEQQFIDSFFNIKNEVMLYVFGSLAVVGVFCRLLYPSILSNAKSKIRLSLNEKLLRVINYNSVTGTEQSFFAKSSYDIEEIINKDFTSKINIIISICTYICAYIYIFISSWIIGLISIVFMVLCYFQNLYIGKKISVLIEKRGIATKKMVSVSHNFFENLSIIKELSSEKKISKRYGDVTENYDSTILSLEKKISLYSTINAVIYFLQKFSIIICGAILFYLSYITPGQFSIFIIMSSILSQPLIVLSQNIQNIKSVSKIKNNLFQEINSVASPVLNCAFIEGKLLVKTKQPVTYSEKLVLLPFKLELEKNKKYLIIGANGAGKTTLLKQLFISLMNTPCKKKVSFINQKSGLMEKSVIDNVSLGDDIDINLITTYFQILGIENVSDLLLQNAKLISSGEAQKTLIVREFVHSKEIFLLDEAFSSIDKKSYSNIMSFILNSNNLVLYVTHDFDLEFMKKFTGIICIDNNKVSLYSDRKEFSSIYEKYKTQK